jgi:hypothetical protein
VTRAQLFPAALVVLDLAAAVVYGGRGGLAPGALLDGGGRAHGGSDVVRGRAPGDLAPGWFARSEWLSERAKEPRG